MKPKQLLRHIPGAQQQQQQQANAYMMVPPQDVTGATQMDGWGKQGLMMEGKAGVDQGRLGGIQHGGR